MTRSALFCLLVLLFSLASLRDVTPYLSEILEDEDGLEQQLKSSWPFFGQLNTEENDLASRREEALQKIQEILGIRSQSENLVHRKVPPQFMIELYNTIVDSSGVAQGRNPYNAKVVRSFIERESSSLSYFYFFNISGLEVNESVLEAELHLYRKKMPLKNLRPSTLTSPCYLIRVYQVLKDRSLDVPDFHRLLNVRCVGAHDSGWQVFNVKHAVLEWINGAPNLGLLVTASTLLEDQVAVEFSRRKDYHHSKQPILVLFNDDKGDRKQSGITNVAPRYYAYANQEYQLENAQQAEETSHVRTKARNEKMDPENKYDSVEHYRRHKQRGQSEEARPENRPGESELFQRRKRRRDKGEEPADGSLPRYDGPSEREAGALRLEVTSGRRRRDVASTKKHSSKIVSSRDTRIARILTSMDIYERAVFREGLGQTVRGRSTRRSIARKYRSMRSTMSGHNATISVQNSTANGECARHELYVDFRDIGLSSSIIAPPGYSAYQCKGVCEPPLRQDQQPTNHATIQAIVHKMGLVKDVGRPCCVPTKLLSTSILFYDDNENVVLKMHEDMIADRCGCR
ncbi:bone morphogenetic protein 10-like [Harpegnathos saltator]|nr:bone morphogenetic protein 10-like [Harpegnathos saltator]